MRVRPYDKDSDFEALEKWRHEFTEAGLNLPHGYEAAQVETVVVENDKTNEKILSLTGFMAVVLNPLIKNPVAKPLDILAALIRADTALSFSAAKIGALGAYITVPVEMVAYHRILQKYGFRPLDRDCVVFEKHLRAPVNKTLQEEAVTAASPVAEDSTPVVE